MLERYEADAPDSKRVYDLVLLLIDGSPEFGICFDSMDDREAKRHGSVYRSGKRGILDVCAAQVRKSGSIVVLETRNE